MSAKEEVISNANPHTIKKFELIEKYVEAWSHKLLQNQYCAGLVFIDCMSNSGEYVDDDGNQVFGTPVRVAKYLRCVAGQYPQKNIDLFFSDLSSAKTDHLKKLIPNDTRNYHCYISTEDGNELAKRLGKHLKKDIHYLLLYDPYDATIDWSSLVPFFNSWSEVILNHMVSDSIRAVKMVKREAAKDKYEQTYLTELENLIQYGSDKDAFEKRIEEIIEAFRIDPTRDYYIAAFPFFNGRNAIVYNLIHCTGNIVGFKLFKQTAWQTFGGKSSLKNSRVNKNQILLDFDGDGIYRTAQDESCYYIKDIAEYLISVFNNREDVPLCEVWKELDKHPVFPSEGFRNEIKKELKTYGVVVKRDRMCFIPKQKEK